jgi:hypothetical protein
MIGYFTDAPGSQRFPAPRAVAAVSGPPKLFIALVGKLSDFGVMREVKSAMSGATGLPVHSINSPRRVPGIENSDHVNFWDAGYPALMVTDTAYLRNPNYHGPNDTWQTLDRRMAQVVQAVYAVTLHSWVGGSGVDRAHGCSESRGRITKVEDHVDEDQSRHRAEQSGRSPRRGITSVILPFMKTAISIPEPVFRRAEQLAKRLGISRSELYSRAVAELVEKHRDDLVTSRLNEVYATES